MIGPRPNFIDSPFFVGEPDNWHLLPGAPKEVVKEFRRYMKQFQNSLKLIAEEDSNYNNITLHQAIREAIIKIGTASIDDITNVINTQSLYIRNDGKPVPKNQVSARISKYSYLFIRENGLIRLNDGYRILYIEASVGGYFGKSYKVSIDLENRKAYYSTYENGYSLNNDKCIELSDSEIRKFNSELDSLKIFEWEKNYYSPALDGTSWLVNIKTNNLIFESSGSNAYPKKWTKFCKCISSLVKGDFY